MLTMNPDVEEQRQGQRQGQADGVANSPLRSALTIGSQKSEAENDSLRSKGSGTFLWVVRHIVRLFLFLEVLSCLVLSKLSFVALAQRFNATISTSQDLEEFEVRKAANFWRLLIPLMIPSLFSLVRCIWCGLISRTRRNYPWPSMGAILAVSDSSFEFVCLCGSITVMRVPQLA